MLSCQNVVKIPKITENPFTKIATKLFSGRYWLLKFNWSLIGDYRLSTLGATQSELIALNFGLKKLLTLSSVGATGPESSIY